MKKYKINYNQDGGWAILSSFNYGGNVHQYSTILSYMLLINTNHNLYNWINNCKNIFYNKLKYIQTLNNITKLYNISNIILPTEYDTYINNYNILVNLIIGSIMPDITSERESICLNKKLSIDELLPDINFNFSYKHAKAIETLSKVNEINEVEEANHAGALSIQHFMLSPTFYDDIQLNNKNINNAIKEIKECIISRILLAQKWYSKKYYNAAYRLIGHVIHTIQDSFSTYHCLRDINTLNIIHFYCFTKPEKKSSTLEWKIKHLHYDIPINVISSDFIYDYIKYKELSFFAKIPIYINYNSNDNFKNIKYNFCIIIVYLFLYFVKNTLFVNLEQNNLDFINIFIDLIINPNINSLDNNTIKNIITKINIDNIFPEKIFLT